MALAAAWDLRRLQQSLLRDDPAPLYFLVGEDAYLIDESLKLLRQQSLKNGAVDFNYDSFYVGEVKTEQVRDTVETLPMMCERRLVIYKGVQALKEGDWERLYPILERPVESSTFVLVADKIDKRKKYFKLLAKQATVVELNPPYENQMPAWIDYIAFQQGLELSTESRSLLQQFVGVNLSEIHNEVKKLKNYLAERKKVEPEDVLAVVSHSKVESIFDLTNAIGRKDRALALTCLANLLEHGQNEVGALALVTRHVRILMGLKEGLRSGLNGAKLSAKVGIPNFFLQQYLAQVRLWDEAKIKKTIYALHETDKALKSSPVSSHIWLENFIIRTCTP